MRYFTRLVSLVTAVLITAALHAQTSNWTSSGGNTTTNDNVDALRFYQRRGFRLAELRTGAVDRSRQEKPQIPRVGDYGIPLHDEIDLTLRV